MKRATCTTRNFTCLIFKSHSQTKQYDWLISNWIGSNWFSNSIRLNVSSGNEYNAWKVYMSPTTIQYTHCSSMCWRSLVVKLLRNSIPNYNNKFICKWEVAIVIKPTWRFLLREVVTFASFEPYIASTKFKSNADN